MLDSYDLVKQDENVPFNADNHLKSLVQDCQSTPLVQLSVFAYTSYPVGWSSLMEEFMLSIKNFEVEICEVNDERGQLEIKFQMIKKKGEVFVWRAVEKAKIISRHVCTECSDNFNDARRLRHFGNKCEECFKKAGNKGSTGTWLDKY